MLTPPVEHSKSNCRSITRKVNNNYCSNCRKYFKEREAAEKVLREELYRQGQAHWDEEAERYGWDDPEQPPNVTKRLQAVLDAPSMPMAREALQKAKQTMQVMILGAWARGRIQGPTTEQSVERRIKRAESLASMLERKGQAEAAQRQWERAAKLREQLDEVREESKGD